MITGRVGTGMLLVAEPNTYTGDAIVLAGGRHALGRAITPQVSGTGHADEHAPLHRRHHRRVRLPPRLRLERCTLARQLS